MAGFKLFAPCCCPAAPSWVVLVGSTGEVAVELVELVESVDSAPVEPEPSEEVSDAGLEGSELPSPASEGLASEEVL